MSFLLHTLTSKRILIRKKGSFFHFMVYVDFVFVVIIRIWKKKHHESFDALAKFSVIFKSNQPQNSQLAILIWKSIVLWIDSFALHIRNGALFSRYDAWLAPSFVDPLRNAVFRIFLPISLYWGSSLQKIFQN